LQTDIPTEIFWCSKCNIPIIKAQDEKEHKCPICGTETKYLCKDLRPVFSEERLLIEILIGTPFEWKGKSVCVNNSRYYINGKVKNVALVNYRDADISRAIALLASNKEDNDYTAFDEFVARFIEANNSRLKLISDEANEFVVCESEKYRADQRIISFSGGKDSTVTADIVIKALRDPSVRHIFGDTTLEMPQTYEYKDRYRKANPQAVFQDGEKQRPRVLQGLRGHRPPPARMMRWCCTMFKTGPITHTFNAEFSDEKVLTFYGIRKSKSVARSKYNRIEDSSSSVKIQKQAVASPIFFWSDADIWLYILGEKIDFNDEYRLGFDRVGCWCCPNNTERSQFLAKIYLPEQWLKWRDYLVSFARSIGKPDPRRIY
jgi:phosphoadenosine phosphosulfate reductase